MPPVVGGAVWCLRLRLELNEDFPKNDAESRRATMVAQAAPTQQATGRDACAHALGRSRWTMSVTAADGTFAVVGPNAVFTLKASKFLYSTVDFGFDGSTLQPDTYILKTGMGKSASPTPMP